MAISSVHRVVALAAVSALLVAASSAVMFAVSEPASAAFTGGAGTSWTITATGPVAERSKPASP